MDISKSWISLVFWATELDTTLSSSICQPASINKSSSGNRARYGFIEVDISDQFSYLGNRARYEFVELDMSTGLDKQIELRKPSSIRVYRSRYIDRPRWDQFSFLGNRAPYEFIELDMSTGLDKQVELRKPSSIRVYRSRYINRPRWTNRPRETVLDMSIPSSNCRGRWSKDSHFSGGTSRILSSSISLTIALELDQFSFLGNRARYEFIRNTIYTTSCQWVNHFNA